MFSMLPLCEATLSNIHVLQLLRYVHLRYVHLRYVATPKRMYIVLRKYINIYTETYNKKYTVGQIRKNL